MENREENIWDVEKVISYDRKRKLYRVRWAGCPKDEDTEEPISEFINLQNKSNMILFTKKTNVFHFRRL